MKFNLDWLGEWLPDLPAADQLAERLTMAGIEVDALESALPDGLTGVRIARVSAVKPHPRAERLKLCRVEAGKHSCQVVCGAANVVQGMMAVLAPPDSQLPDIGTIKEKTVRGEISSGMLCGEDELGLVDRSDGKLLELPTDAPSGQLLSDYLQLDDWLLSLDLTPNRGDCLSLLGVAREIAAQHKLPTPQPPVDNPVTPGSSQRFPVEVRAGDACPRYVCRVISDLPQPLPRAPLWLRERLRRAGYRSISPIVDITNYVMLELGQPLHAFDLDRLQGGICVRLAMPGETLTLIDGTECVLGSDELVIADRSAPVALAGVMGGRDSEIGAKSDRILLEAAWFAPTAVAGRARRHKLHSEAARRFERGVDPAMTVAAIERASALILKWAGGCAGPLQCVDQSRSLPQPLPIDLRRIQIKKVLGLDSTQLDDRQIETLFRALGIDCQPVDGGWRLTPPTWRSDLVIEADLLEELARLYGYNRLPSRMPRMSVRFASRPANQYRDFQLADLLAVRGYSQILTLSTVQQQRCQLIEPELSPVLLANPLNSDQNAMRSGLWQGLLETMAFNLRHQQQDLSLFESGRCFSFDGDSKRPRERQLLALLRCGKRVADNWDAQDETDFFDVKSDVQVLLDVFGGSWDFVADQPHPALHPHRSARIVAADGSGETVGTLGVLHPQLIGSLKLRELKHSAAPVLAQIDVGQLRRIRRSVVARVPYLQPALGFDLGLVTPAAVTAGQLQQALHSIIQARLRLFLNSDDVAGFIEKLYIFDVYRGSGIPSGHRCISFRMYLRHNQRAFNEKLISDIINTAANELNLIFGVRLRDSRYSEL